MQVLKTLRCERQFSALLSSDESSYHMWCAWVCTSMHGPRWTEMVMFQPQDRCRLSVSGAPCRRLAGDRFNQAVSSRHEWFCLLVCCFSWPALPLHL